MIQPKALKAGDTVVILCTARKFSVAEAQVAVQLLESWGLVPLLGSTIGLDNFQLGGTDSQRRADLQAAMDHPNIQAIWCARGGYGTVRIIDALDFTEFVKKPKWLIGFSDVTVLHSHLHNLGVQTLHAIMAFSVATAAKQSIDSLKLALFGQSLDCKFTGSKHNRTGSAQGVLTGGNLSILYSLLGSASAISTEKKILFIEDLDEYLYHVDRMMFNLKRNGYFDQLAGLIVGGMSDMHDNSIPFGLDAVGVVLDLTREFDFPICFDFPAGHGKVNQALKLGQQVVLDVAKSAVTLTYMDDGIAQ